MITVFLLSTIHELYRSKKLMGELGRADQWKKGPTVSSRRTRRIGSNLVGTAGKIGVIESSVHFTMLEVSRDQVN